MLLKSKNTIFMLLPPYLKKGQTIGITCPAGYMIKEKAQSCIAQLQKWGFEVMVGNTLGSQSNNYFSGTDEERRDEMQAMLDDDSIHAILCARGGYGTGRIIEQLDFSHFRKKPKWIIGFSDITVLHCHLFSKFKIASLHAPMAAAFADGLNEFNQSLYKSITGKKASYTTNSHPFNKKGKVSGELVGGNLSLFTHLIGTNSEVDTKDKILFLEDIGEQIYNIDRMLYQLKRSGKLQALKGLIIGGFTDIKDTDRPFGQTVQEVIRAIIADCTYPVCYEFPVSHEKENFALKVGGQYELNVARSKVNLKEIA